MPVEHLNLLEMQLLSTLLLLRPRLRLPEERRRPRELLLERRDAGFEFTNDAVPLVDFELLRVDLLAEGRVLDSGGREGLGELARGGELGGWLGTEEGLPGGTEG